MSYFDPTPPQTHRCATPAAPASHGVPTDQTGWRCECGKAYVLHLLGQHGESWWQWKRSPEHDLTDPNIDLVTKGN